MASYSSRSSCSTSASSVEDLLLPAFAALPKPPPRKSSIATTKRKAPSVSNRELPVPLTLEPFSPIRASTFAIQEDYFNHKDLAVQEDYFNHKDLQRRASEPSTSSTTRCFCGTTVTQDDLAPLASRSSSAGIYCSRRCARQDALNALEGSSPCLTDLAEDDCLPLTPSNEYFSAPAAKACSDFTVQQNSYSRKRMASIGSSHYRRMEALGLYDDSPTKRNTQAANALLEAASASLHTPPSIDTCSAYNPRQSLFFPVPVYLDASP